MKTMSAVTTCRFARLLLASTFLFLVAAGCSRYVGNFTSSSSISDAKAITNRTSTGDIPANLKSFEVDNRFGAVHVTATDSGPTQWSWKLTVGAKTDTLAVQAADAASCVATRQDGEGLRLVVSLPQSAGGLSFQSDLEIRVPKSVALRTRNLFGETTISGSTGDIEATGQNGSVEVRDATGKVHAQTSFASLVVKGAGPAWLKNQNGSIEAANIHGPLDAETSFATLHAQDIDGALDARDQNGRIEALRIKGRANIKTSFADIHAEGIAGDATLADQNGRISARDITGSVDAHTSFANLEIESTGHNFKCRNQNGTIQLHASSPEVATIDAQTSFAGIEVFLPAGLKPAIQARTTFAEVESDFPVMMKPEGQNALAEADPASPRITLKNQNGPIRIVGEKSTAAR
ncbi:MAG: hypothetical protein JWR26_4774 [Pedosphaera sp.]|nr:hypothetical protein [Pedosphaera sp.]